MPGGSASSEWRRHVCGHVPHPHGHGNACVHMYSLHRLHRAGCTRIPRQRATHLAVSAVTRACPPRAARPGARSGRGWRVDVGACGQGAGVHAGGGTQCGRARRCGGAGALADRLAGAGDRRAGGGRACVCVCVRVGWGVWGGGRCNGLTRRGPWLHGRDWRSRTVPISCSMPTMQACPGTGRVGPRLVKRLVACSEQACLRHNQRRPRR